ncbi:hypothetical protein HPB49_018573 [Dermacentor silvarum]|uniref:Uncharacterized protein n=1 Tax=Dermacentor silvarum TaxID=543639 RepID=A0ACB8C4T3_DERSI|nr:hypothetical protein HPB49_018573 [Dermacentor silvarum]
MTDVSLDAVQRNHIRRIVRSSKANTSLNPRHSGHHALCVCGAASSAAVIVTAVSLGIYFSSRGGLEQENPEQGDNFCCPEEVQELARYVNTSLNPCKDFFEYVCSGAITDKHSTRGDDHAELVRMAITGVTPRGVERGRAGRLLTGFYGTCVQTAPHRELYVSTLATALARNTWSRLRTPNTTNAFAYLVTASVKFGMPSLVLVTIERLPPVMLLSMGTPCAVERPKALLAAALRASREALRVLENSTANTHGAEDAASLDAKLCKRFATVGRRSATYTMAKESDVFDREVWNVSDLHASLTLIGHSAQSLKTVVVETVRQIRLLHDFFAEGEDAADLKAAYLIWHSVARAAENFYAFYDGSPSGVFDKCVDGLFRVPHVWDTFAAEVFTSPEKDVEVQATFEVLKDTVLSDCQKSSLFEADDAEGLRRFFTDLTLLTPTKAGERPVAIPGPTDTYGENILRLRACEFDMASLSDQGDAVDPLSYLGLRFVDERHLQIPSSVYTLIRTGSPNHDVPNILLVGSWFADRLWYMILYGLQWSPKTRDNIDRFKACLAMNYFRDASRGLEVDTLTVTALGLSSVANALRSTAWNAPKPLWGLRLGSRAQFIYMLSTYYRCPTVRSPMSVRLINAPLTYIGDFGEAFGCSTTSPMMKPRRCSMQDVSRD